MIRLWCVAALLGLLGFFPAEAAEKIRIATFHTELERDGPGLLYRDISRALTNDIDAVIATITEANADILLLQGVDHDADMLASQALRDRIRKGGLDYPYIFAAQTNRGLLAGVDLDGDDAISLPSDAHGYGAFRGQGSMVLMSRWPVLTDAVQDFSTLLWKDLPAANLPMRPDGMPFLSVEAAQALRLSTTGHWVVPILTPAGRLDVLAFHATPPVFDGPEDLNGLRNADELNFWQHYLDGEFGSLPDVPFALLGVVNLDPAHGVGNVANLSRFLNDPRIRDPEPRGLKGLATAEWETVAPSRQRVDYILPSSRIDVLAAGVLWPPLSDASRHGLVWVDVVLPSTPAAASDTAVSGGVD